MIAKCIKSEKEGRKIFYGAMISESVIALVWAAAGVAFYGTTQLLSDALANGASNVVYEISTGVLGVFGGVLAVAGVIVCPITSSDTAFRSARLILAETFHLNQKKIKNRLLITIPLLVVGGLLTWFAIVNDNGFQIIWRYFSWSNQTLAMIALWVATAYLLKKRQVPLRLTAHSISCGVHVRSQPDLHYDGSGGLQAHSDNFVHLRRFVCRGTVRNLSGIPYPQAKDS